MKEIMAWELDLIKEVDFGSVYSFYTAEELTQAKREAWESSKDSWEEEKKVLISCLTDGSDECVDETLDTMESIEMDWGAAPATDRIREILGE